MSTVTFPGSLPRTIEAPENRLRRPGLRTVESVEQFRAALYRESARTDRSGREFSLILIRPNPVTQSGSRSWRMVRKVLRRARDTDRIGWFADGLLGVILPDTSAEGSARLVHDLRIMLATPTQPPQFQTFVYPSQWPDDTPPKLMPTTESEIPSAKFQPRDLLPELLDQYVGSTPISSSGAGAMEVLLAHPLPWWKRGTDIAGSFAGIVAASPVMLAAAAAIKMTSPGPVLFVQQRAGLAGRPFPIYKFRTMHTNAEARKQELRQHSEQDGPAFKMANDPRVTRIGKLLRKTSIDELPQLFNILKGDMTLVGPRPLPLREANGCARWQRRRLDVTPGLTCIWQVKGRSTVSFAEWIRMDIRYIRRRTFLQDMKLILQTIPAVLFQRGAR